MVRKRGIEPALQEIIRRIPSLPFPPEQQAPRLRHEDVEVRFEELESHAPRPGDETQGGGDE